MSITPQDDRETRAPHISIPAGHAEPSYSGDRSQWLAVTIERAVDQAKQRLAMTLKNGFNRVLSPGLAGKRGRPLSDETTAPSACPAIGNLPPRTFPVTYPARSYRYVTNQVDLVSEVDEDTITISYPDVSGAEIESDTWMRVKA